VVRSLLFTREQNSYCKPDLRERKPQNTDRTSDNSGKKPHRGTLLRNPNFAFLKPFKD
jgi:hypothetical protein